MLSKTGLQQLSEAELRTKVLIPMFVSMGFRDVRHFHGPSELGKDIVMWRPNSKGLRENYAAVVKASPIRGEVQGGRGITPVLVQITQAFGSEYADPVDFKRRKIHKVWVITPFNISKEAVEALGASLRGERRQQGAVQLFGGDELWELLKKHSPERTILGELHSASSFLDDANPNYRVTARLRGGLVQLGLEPKHADAHKVEPLRFHAQFQFPKTNRGRAVKAALSSHFRKGTPVSVPAEFIDALKLPDVLRPFFDEGTTELAFGVARSDVVMQVSVTARDNTEQQASLRGVRLGCVRKGSEEVELATMDEMVWSFDLVLNRRKKRATLTFRTGSVRRNAKQEFDAARFQACLSRGASLAVVDEATGIPLVNLEMPVGKIEGPSEPWLRFAEALDFLQQATGVPIYLPKAGVVREDFEAVLDLAEKIRSGIWEGVVNEITLTLNPGALPEMSRFIDKPQGDTVSLSREEWLDIFDVHLPLGTALIVAKNMRLADESRDAMKDAPLEEPFEMKIVRRDETPNMWLAYTKWLNPAQVEEVRRRWPGVRLDATSDRKG